MDEERLQRIQRILSCTEALAHGFNPGRDRAWIQCDLTMPQLKALIYVTKNDSATSGQIANSLGTSLSTMTGVVDRLVEQGMASRYEETWRRSLADRWKGECSCKRRTCCRMLKASGT